MKKVLLIINPVSGTLKGKASLFDIVEAFDRDDIEPAVRLTHARGHARELSREACASGSYDAVICCGGDGTLNEAIAGMISSGKKTPIGYIPAGSTNDFASGLGLPLKPADAARGAAAAIRDGGRLPLDIGLFNNDTYFTYIASFGAFTESSYNTPQSLKNALGHLAYVLQGVHDFFQIKPIHAKVTANGRTYEDDYVFAGVCNSYSVGGIVKLTEDEVNLSDGLFEVVLVRNPKNPAELNRIADAALTANFDCDMMEFFRTSEITFTVPEGTRWSLDGEMADGGSTVRIENLCCAAELLKKDKSSR